MKLILGLLLVACSLRAFQANSTLALSTDGNLVYDSVNNVSWLANANLAASNRFGLPLCTGPGVQSCVNASGSMNYTSAAAWVGAMNAANYLGHSNWQIPTTPPIDPGCTKTGPNGNSFGYGCSASAFGSLYYNGLGIKAPNTAVPIPANTVGPFSNLQPYLYWSQTNTGSQGNNTFAFNTGWEGANTPTHVIYVWPMIPGKLPGTPAATGQGLQVNPGGQTVYDPVSNVTWLANANLAASNSFGLPPCQGPSAPAICANPDGALNLDSANQFIANMNAGAGYLGQKNWQLPAVDPSCSGFNCGSNLSPMGELFYGQFGLSKGMAAVSPPNIAVGPFHNIQPYLYWTCLAAKIQDPCETTPPVVNQEFSFSFGNGFAGTDVLNNNMFVTAYYVGAPTVVPAPVVLANSVVNNASFAAGTNPLAPGTIAAIFGTNLTDGTSCLPPNCNPVFGSDGKLGTTMAGAQVLVNGTAVPLFYAAPGQLGVQIPFELTGTSASVAVTVGTQRSVAATVPLAANAPGIFTFTADGKGAGAITHASGAPVTTQSPATKGEIVILYATGLGPVTPAVATGAVPAGASSTVAPVTLTIGGIAVTPDFAGLAGCCVGLNQVNFKIPAGVSSGSVVPVVLTIGGKSSNATTIAIQ